MNKMQHLERAGEGDPVGRDCAAGRFPSRVQVPGIGEPLGRALPIRVRGGTRIVEVVANCGECEQPIPKNEIWARLKRRDGNVQLVDLRWVCPHCGDELTVQVTMGEGDLLGEVEAAAFNDLSGKDEWLEPLSPTVDGRNECLLAGQRVLVYLGVAEERLPRVALRVMRERLGHAAYTYGTLFRAAGVFLGLCSARKYR